MGKQKKIAILGSTGSIGTQTLEVIRHFPGEFEVVALAAGNNWELLAEQAREFQPGRIFLGEESNRENLANQLAKTGTSFNHLEVGFGNLTGFARELECDLAVVATVGWAGVEPTMALLDRGIDIALANKEVLVCAGDIVMAKARETVSARTGKPGISILPIDSEHNALMQCLYARNQDGSKPDTDRIRRLILTASGGPFRTASPAEIMNAKAARTLDHPTWTMGSKITVDSATLMNKGFEVIEAHHLFNIEGARIEVVVHPQSIIHSMIEFIDGSIIAQLGKTDMILPIQNILTHPQRCENWLRPLDFTTLGSLDFAAPDLEKFPCLRMAFEAMTTGGSVPCALNAANEIAVAAHLRDEITCGQIPVIIEKILNNHTTISTPSLSDLVEVDREIRRQTLEMIEGGI